ncbi:MAG: S8 family serine peptidase, partial [Bdellovibrionales bacterium]|nr:S8 family serine peptidase [Bdellovibrionales bacterium]
IEPNYIFDKNFETNRRKWPKDKYFFQQWYLNNVGQSAPFGLPGQRGSDLDAMKLIKENIRESSDVVVAVIDTGIDYTHPDLKENMWTNTEEVNGVDGIDDDKNGFTDDKYGFDFYSEGSTKLWYGKPGDADPRDENGHGTHCAGVIGAKGDNNIGIVGLNQNVKLMAVKIFGANGGANSADIQRAIYYAADRNVDIMTNSWGGTTTSELTRQAIEEAGKKGILFVAAAGNDSVNNDVEPHFPSSYKTRTDTTQRVANILSVGASDNQDNPASFSNYGYETVDVFAPGVLIMSTYPTDLIEEGKPPYVVMSGTSMATPLVTGVAALMMAANPSLRGNPEKVRQILIDTSDPSPGLVGKSVSNGRVNAYNAVKFESTKSLKLTNWKTKNYQVDNRRFNQELVDIRHKIEVKDAKAVSAHFNFVQIAEPFDSIYFYDKHMRFISSLEKTESVDVWSPIVPGDTMYVRFVNAKLKTIKTQLNMESNTVSACDSIGGVLEYTRGLAGCRMDSIDSSSDGTEVFNSFYSEGYSIDKIKYAL